MAASTSPLKIARSGLAARQAVQAEEHEGFRPELIKYRNDAKHESMSLRMFTEEQVAELLQVSLSKLRKWRMKSSEKDEQGPPFKKIGRLVRYPEAGLQAYINGE